MNAIDTLDRESSTSNAIATCFPAEGTDIKHEQPVIITGMHKSGTSLTSSVLQASGVHIGENLMGPGPGNYLGHFEDMELYALHCHALASQGIHMDGWTAQSRVSMPQQFLPRVQNLLEHRQKSPRLWGWKDPRTTLFLDFWKQTLPNAKFVFVYRNPWEVV
ncbi:MAG: sulfotransferase, partial [Cyanobacteria bacterium J06632_3]